MVTVLRGTPLFRSNPTLISYREPTLFIDDVVKKQYFLPENTDNQIKHITNSRNNNYN